MPTNSESTEQDPPTLECEHCGDEFEEGEGVSGSGSVKEAGLEKLGDGESIGIDELFAFDESYCSMDCCIAAGDSGE